MKRKYTLATSILRDCRAGVDLTPEDVVGYTPQCNTPFWEERYANFQEVDSPGEYEYLCYGIINYERATEKLYDAFSGVVRRGRVIHPFND